MNKKLLLVSLLAVGMLVGCGGKGGDTSVAPSEVPASSETPASNEEGGESQLTGKYGKKGYYLFGTGNNWDNIFWTRTNFEIFYLAPVGDGTYSLTGSIAGEDIPASGKWEYKVRYFDGDGNFSTWFPDGVDNNGVITEAGQYTFVFNPDSTEKAHKETDGSEYTLFTKATRNGDAVETDRLKISSETRSDIEQVRSEAKLRISVEGLPVEKGKHVYAYSWDDNFLNGWKELEASSSNPNLYETTFANVLVGLGPLTRTYNFCIVISDVELVDGKPADKAAEDALFKGKVGGDWSVTYSKHKLSASVSVDYLKLHPTMTPDEFITYVDGLQDYDYKKAPVYAFIKGVVVGKPVYNETFKSYNITLEDTTDGKTVAIYSGALRDGEVAPKEGATVSAYGIVQIYKSTKYQVAFDKTNKVSPIVYNVENPDPQYWVRGSFDESWNTLDDYKFALGEEGHYSLSVNLAADTNFKVATKDWSDEWNYDTVTFANDEVKACFRRAGEGKDETNIVVVTAGTYNFTIDISGENHTCTISK